MGKNQELKWNLVEGDVIGVGHNSYGTHLAIFVGYKKRGTANFMYIKYNINHLKTKYSKGLSVDKFKMDYLISYQHLRIVKVDLSGLNGLDLKEVSEAKHFYLTVLKPKIDAARK